MVAHQPTYRAMNQFGQWFDACLESGAFKTMPNNPTRPDGVVHQYCPSEHVDSEPDNLLSWYGEYIAQADDGDLRPLVGFTTRLHRQSILQAK